MNWPWQGVDTLESVVSKGLREPATMTGICGRGGEGSRCGHLATTVRAEGREDAQARRWRGIRAGLGAARAGPQPRGTRPSLRPPRPVSGAAPASRWARARAPLPCHLRPPDPGPRPAPPGTQPGLGVPESRVPGGHPRHAASPARRSQAQVERRTRRGKPSARRCVRPFGRLRHSTADAAASTGNVSRGPGSSGFR